MLNVIWTVMIIIAVVFGACTGKMEDVTNAALSSAGEAISLAITMAGVVAFWMGLMEIAKRAGLILRMTKGISPFLTFMFPDIPKNHPAREYIATNMIANILGLGWACTPAGLKAMEALADLEKERNPKAFDGVASNEMCTFLILNISSLQLIPVNMIAYRTQYGSVSPTSIIGPAIVATMCSTLAAIVFCKIKNRGMGRLGSHKAGRKNR